MQKRQPCKECIRDTLSHCVECVLGWALSPDQFNPHQTRETEGQEAECGFERLAQLFSLGAIHLSLVVALCICCMAAYVLATFGTHYISFPSSQFPSLLVSCMSIYSSIRYCYIAMPALCPLCFAPLTRYIACALHKLPILKPSVDGAEFSYILPNIHISMHIYMYMHSDMLYNKSYLFH